MTCRLAASICFQIKKHIFKINMHGVSVCHVVSPEKQESWDVNEQLFSIFQPRKAEKHKCSKTRLELPFLWRKREKLHGELSERKQELKVPSLRKKYK